MVELVCAAQHQIEAPDFLRLRICRVQVYVADPSLHRTQLHFLPRFLEVLQKLEGIVESAIDEGTTDSRVQPFLILLVTGGCRAATSTPHVLLDQRVELPPELFILG